ESKMAAAAISRAKVKTATNSVSGSAEISASISLDAYSFFPDIKTLSTTAINVATRTGSSASADTPGFSLIGQNFSYSVAWRYIAA
ncbi:hypothetical protein RZS08_52015, partial [Arthrospira platensis SPKY1]|nr:hypothetical protein [Arthrospira platensis SPKY1]